MPLATYEGSTYFGNMWLRKLCELQHAYQGHISVGQLDVSMTFYQGPKTRRKHLCSDLLPTWTKNVRCIFQRLPGLQRRACCDHYRLYQSDLVLEKGTRGAENEFGIKVVHPEHNTGGYRITNRQFKDAERFEPDIKAFEMTEFDEEDLVNGQEVLGNYGVCKVSFYNTMRHFHKDFNVQQFPQKDKEFRCYNLAARREGPATISDADLKKFLQSTTKDQHQNLGSMTKYYQKLMYMRNMFQDDLKKTSETKRKLDEPLLKYRFEIKLVPGKFLEHERACQQAYDRIPFMPNRVKHTDFGDDIFPRLSEDEQRMYDRSGGKFREMKPDVIEASYNITPSKLFDALLYHWKITRAGCTIDVTAPSRQHHLVDMQKKFMYYSNLALTILKFRSNKKLFYTMPVDIVDKIEGTLVAYLNIAQMCLGIWQDTNGDPEDKLFNGRYSNGQYDLHGLFLFARAGLLTEYRTPVDMQLCHQLLANHHSLRDLLSTGYSGCNNMMFLDRYGFGRGLDRDEVSPSIFQLYLMEYMTLRFGGGLSAPTARYAPFFDFETSKTDEVNIIIYTKNETEEIPYTTWIRPNEYKVDHGYTIVTLADKTRIFIDRELISGRQMTSFERSKLHYGQNTRAIYETIFGSPNFFDLTVQRAFGDRGGKWLLANDDDTLDEPLRDTIAFSVIVDKKYNMESKKKWVGRLRFGRARPGRVLDNGIYVGPMTNLTPWKYDRIAKRNLENMGDFTSPITIPRVIQLYDSKFYKPKKNKDLSCGAGHALEGVFSFGFWCRFSAHVLNKFNRSMTPLMKLIFLRVVQCQQQGGMLRYNLAYKYGDSGGSIGYEGSSYQQNLEEQMFFSNPTMLEMMATNLIFNGDNIKVTKYLTRKCGVAARVLFSVFRYAIDIVPDDYMCEISDITGYETFRQYLPYQHYELMEGRSDIPRLVVVFREALENYPNVEKIAELFKLEVVGRELDSRASALKLQTIRTAQVRARRLMEDNEAAREQEIFNVPRGNDQRGINIMVPPSTTELDPEPSEDERPHLVEDEEDMEENDAHGNSLIGSDISGIVDSSATGEVSASSSSNVRGTRDRTETRIPQELYDVFRPELQKKLQSKHDYFARMKRKHDNYLRKETFFDSASSGDQNLIHRTKRRRTVELMYQTVERRNNRDRRDRQGRRVDENGTITHVRKEFEFPDPENHSRMITRTMEVEIDTETTEDINRKEAIRNFQIRQRQLPGYARSSFVAGIFGQMKRRHNAFSRGNMRSFLSPKLDNWFAEFENAEDEQELEFNNGEEEEHD